MKFYLLVLNKNQVSETIVEDDYVQPKEIRSVPKIKNKSLILKRITRNLSIFNKCKLQQSFDLWKNNMMKAKLGKYKNALVKLLIEMKQIERNVATNETIMNDLKQSFNDIIE